MNDAFPTLAGVLFGAIGCYLGIRNYTRDLKKEWQAKLQAEIDRNSDSKVKAYAAERDFNHLKNNQEQLKLAVSDLQTEFEELKDSQIEMRTLMNASYTQLQILSSRVTEGSAGWMKPHPNQS